MRKIHLPGAGHGLGRAEDRESQARPEAAATPDIQARPEPRARQRDPWAGRLEVIIAVALGLTAIVGAFAAYKNEQRNHAASAEFSNGIANFDSAGQLSSTANATLLRDQAQFLAYTTALHDNKPKLAAFLFNNVMDTRLQRAVRWWQSPANTAQAHPAPTPFSPKDPEYVISEARQAQQNVAASDANFAAAHHQQENADHYTLVEVILATALFLYGIAGVASGRTLKLGTLGIGAAIFLLALVLLITG